MNTHMPARFTGKVAFITGAGSGIGRATALAFAAEGAAAAVVDVNEDSALETVRQIEALGGTGLAIRCEVSDDDQVNAAVDRTVTELGGLDIAFNNAGVELRPTPIVDITEADWSRVLDINLRGIFLCMKHQIPRMLDRGAGAIVNTSSGAGIKGFRGGAAYGASKFGVIGLTKCAAVDYADQGIRINAICPGIIDTEMMDRFTGGTDAGRAAVVAQEPIGRMGAPAEIAASVLWLCSEEAAFAVGHALVIDGGQTV